jgi:hypothetical protein
VIGLVPRAVRIDLEPSELPALLDELFTTIEARGGSLREEHERDSLIAAEDVLDASALLHEYARILVDLGAHSRRSVVDTAEAAPKPMSQVRPEVCCWSQSARPRGVNRRARICSPDADLAGATPVSIAAASSRSDRAGLRHRPRCRGDQAQRLAESHCSSCAAAAASASSAAT